jgi:hypothetical protein
MTFWLGLFLFGAALDAVIAAPYGICLSPGIKAGMALGPLAAGVLGVSVAFAVEPFAPRRFLWSGVVAAIGLPGIVVFGLVGMAHERLFLLAMIALTGGFAARAWEGETGPAFLAGICGGLAVWLTPVALPFVLMIFAAMLGRWLVLPSGGVMAAGAAGFADVIGFGFTIDPPPGGYAVAATGRLSVVHVALALLLLAGALGLWRLERYGGWRRWRFWAGAGMAALPAIWLALFPAVARGWFGLMAQPPPLRWPDCVRYLLPGVLALMFSLWRVLRVAGLAANWLAAWGSICILISLVLAGKIGAFIAYPGLAAALLLPVMLSEVSFRLAARPNAAMFGRLAVLAAVLALPNLAAFVHVPDVPVINRPPVCGAGTPVVAGRESGIP